MKGVRFPLALSGLAAGASAVVIAAGGAGASAAGGLPTLTVALNGKSVAVGGSMVSGAVNVQTSVTGEKPGETILFRLDPGVDPSVFDTVTRLVNAHRGDVNYTMPYGQIVFDAPDTSGTSSAQTVLTPGTYFAIDNHGNGPPRRMVFTVTQSSAPATLPRAAATVSTIDFGFRGPTKLHTGELVKWVNDGFVAHMDDWIRVKNTASAKLLIRGLLANQRSAQRLAIGFGEFAGPMSNGGMIQSVVTLRPGIYVQACFMDAQDGRNHTQLGMERIIKVVK